MTTYRKIKERSSATPLKLTRAEWGRILAEARNVAGQLDVRRRHLEMEGGTIPGGTGLASSFLSDRIEVHIGTIQLMRPGRSRQDPLVAIPLAVERGLAALIGEEAVKRIAEIG